MMPASKLDDPGIGLRDNGRRVLTYSDLRSVFADPDGRDPGRTIELHLTGHMEKFAWSFDGVKFSDAEPLRFNYGERLRIVLDQRHDDDASRFTCTACGAISKTTRVNSPFASTPSTCRQERGARYRVRADALGRWAYHCHLLFHMEAGMFREVRVDE